MPWLASLAMHVCLIAVAFFLVWSVTSTDDGPAPVMLSFDDPAPPPPAAAATPEAAVEQAAAPPLPTAAPDDLAALVDAAAPLEALAPLTAPAELPALSTSVRPPVVFSGLGANEARDIVYVVDASGSMITTFPEIRAELARSIEKLHPTQRFQVLFFSNATEAKYLRPDIPPGLRRPTLIDATLRNKRAVLEWVNAVAPRGGSNPLEALRAAIGMKPDVIFILSTRITGPEAIDFDPDTVLEELDQLNPVSRRAGRRLVAIKVIEILDQDPLGIMRAIAAAHGGEDGYNFISRDEINRRGGLPGSAAP